MSNTSSSCRTSSCNRTSSCDCATSYDGAATINSAIGAAATVLVTGIAGAGITTAYDCSASIHGSTSIHGGSPVSDSAAPAISRSAARCNLLQIGR